MACQLITTSGAVFALWGEPESEDIEKVRSTVEAAAASSGHPIIYVTRVPVEAPAPNAQFRAELQRMTPSC